MPYRRTYRRRRTSTTALARSRRPMRTMRRRYTRRVSPLVKYKINNIHSFKRSVRLIDGGSTSGATGTYFRAFVFQLADLPAYTEFTALYDYYKIRAVTINIIWRSSNLSMIETSNNTARIGMPVMYYLVDRDDASTPTDTDQLREYSRAKRFEFDTGKRTCRIFIKCNTIQQGAETSGTAGKQLIFNKWSDCASPTIYHYGLKVGIYVPFLAGQAPTVNYFDVEATYYLSFKDPR